MSEPLYSVVKMTEDEIFGTPLSEARRGLMAIRLEVPKVVADDLTARVEAAFSAFVADLQRLQTERDALREALTDVVNWHDDFDVGCRQCRIALDLLAATPDTTTKG